MGCIHCFTFFQTQHFISGSVSIIGSQSRGGFLKMGPLEAGLGVDTTSRLLCGHVEYLTAITSHFL